MKSHLSKINKIFTERMPTVKQLIVQFCILSDCTVYSRGNLKNIFFWGKRAELAVSATQQNLNDF
jgi:hypothetical protein